MGLLSEKPDISHHTPLVRVEVKSNPIYKFSPLPPGILQKYLEEELKEIPIIQIDEEHIKPILDNPLYIYPKYSPQFQFYHIGDPGRRSSDPMVYEYMMKPSQYSKPVGIQIYFA